MDWQRSTVHLNRCSKNWAIPQPFFENSRLWWRKSGKEYIGYWNEQLGRREDHTKSRRLFLAACTIPHTSNWNGPQRPWNASEQSGLASEAGAGASRKTRRHPGDPRIPQVHRAKHQHEASGATRIPVPSPEPWHFRIWDERSRASEQRAWCFHARGKRPPCSKPSLMVRSRLAPTSGDHCKYARNRQGDCDTRQILPPCTTSRKLFDPLRALSLNNNDKNCSSTLRTWDNLMGPNGSKFAGFDQRFVEATVPVVAILVSQGSWGRGVRQDNGMAEAILLAGED